MTISWSPFGLEKYFLDGKLIEKRWSWSFSGTREFVVDNARLRIEFRLSFREYFSRVYVNDALHIEELFPEVAARFAAARSRAITPRTLFTRMAVWMAIGFIAMFSYRTFEQYKHKTAAQEECPAPGPSTNTDAARG